MIPIPDIVSIKEKFMVYGRDTVKVPPLLSLQLAGDPQTHVRPSHALWVPVWGELAFGVGRPWSWSLGDVVVTLCRVRPFGSAVSLAALSTGLGSTGSLEGLEWDPGLTLGLHCPEGPPWGCHGPAEPLPSPGTP